MRGYKVKSIAPTATKGARFTVKNLCSGEIRTTSFDHSANNPRIAAIKATFGAPSEPVYVGQETDVYFYVVDYSAF